MHQLAMFDGLAERDRIIAAMRDNHPSYVASLTEFAVAHCARSADGTVTIDDVRDAIARTEFPMPEEVGADPRIFGTIFPRRTFVPVGITQSRRAEHVKRSGRARSAVTVYRLREAA